jgi:acetolactate synthase-1/2/3 large subunit
MFRVRIKPVVLLGAGGKDKVEQVLSWGLPILTSWQAKDMVDNAHPLYFGSPGVYGQRCANKVLHNADSVIVLGNRLSIWNVGYEGIKQELIEESEPASPEWMAQCKNWRAQYPLHIPESGTHDDKNGYINSYHFAYRLQDFLSPDEVIVTEMGAALMAAHQMLCIKPPQRLMTSGGLGEMGCGLPAAIGASFARNKGSVLCLSTDGGMMMNLQELQTIVHHRLPVKIIVFNNSGYGMLKHTQDNAGMKHSGVDAGSGVSFPNFRHVALAFGISASEVRTWEDFNRIIPSFMKRSDGPELVDFIMDPRQKFLPKLEPVFVNGKPTSPAFDQMSP